MPPLYNFTTHSSTPKPSAMDTASDQASSLRITLTPIHDPADKRTITLTLGTPVKIGRSSRSGNNEKQLAVNNALFHCPVISREHAQLELQPALPGATTKVVIKDLESMHGTFVNSKRLERNVPNTLMDGDNLRFGNRVERVHDLHEGFTVNFRYADPLFTYGRKEKDTTGRFTVPDESEDFSDDSYGGSIIEDDDNASVVLTSSAKTTPDKAEEGSSTRPVSVSANKPGSSIHDVIDLDAESLPRAQTVIHVNPTVVHDSLDEANAFVADSYAADAGARYTKPAAESANSGPVDAFAEQIHDVAVGNDKEDSPAAPDDLNPYDSYSDDEDNSYAGDYNEDDDDEEMDDDDDDDDAASDSHAADADSQSEHSENEGPDVMSSKRQPSPELGSLGQTDDKTAQTAEMDTSSAIPSNRHYDPVRGFQPPSSGQAQAAVSAMSSSTAYKPRSYANPIPSTYWQNGAANDVYSRKWDAVPLPGAYPYTADYNQYMTNFSPGYMAPSNARPIERPVLSNHWDPTAHSKRPPPRAQPQAYDFPTFQLQPNSGLTLPSTAYPAPAPVAKVAAPTAQPKKPVESSKVSVMDLVQDAAAQAERRISSEQPAPKPASKPVATGSKRKAADISDYMAIGEDFDGLYKYLTPEDLELFPELAALHDPKTSHESPKTALSHLPAEFYQSSSASTTQEAPPPKKKAKTTAGAKSTTAKIAKTAGWMTLGGFAGTMVTIGFLCSPFAERLIEAI